MYIARERDKERVYNEKEKDKRGKRHDMKEREAFTYTNIP